HLAAAIVLSGELSWARELLGYLSTGVSNADGVPLVLAFIGFHVLAASVAMPCSPFTLLAGSLWGIFPGALISIVASTAAMAATFALGRLARSFEPIKNFLGKFLPESFFRRPPTRFDWGIVLAIQLNPAMPAS